MFVAGGYTGQAENRQNKPALYPLGRTKSVSVVDLAVQRLRGDLEGRRRYIVSYTNRCSTIGRVAYKILSVGVASTVACALHGLLIYLTELESGSARQLI